MGEGCQKYRAPGLYSRTRLKLLFLGYIESRGGREGRGEEIKIGTHKGRKIDFHGMNRQRARLFGDYLGEEVGFLGF